MSGNTKPWGPKRCPACASAEGDICDLHRQQIRADQMDRNRLERRLFEQRRRYAAKQRDLYRRSLPPTTDPSTTRDSGKHDWPSWRNFSGSAFRKGKMRSLDDRRMPDQYKFDNILVVPPEYMSSKMEQDRGLAIKERNIRHETPGPRRNAMEKDLEVWIGNGMPTYAGGLKDPNRGTAFLPINKHDAVDTRRHGTVLSDDLLKTNDWARETQKILRSKPRHTIHGRKVA